MTVSMSARLALFHGFPGQVCLSLHVVDRIHFGVLVGFVEFDTARHAGETLCSSKAVPDGLGILSAAAHHVCDQHDLVIGMSVEVRRICVIFDFECLNELTNDITLVGRIELNNADIAQGSLSGLLLKTEGQPNRTELYGLAATTL